MQELPSTLLDLFDSLDVDLYDSGCIICEVRDLRRRAPSVPTPSLPSPAAAADVSHVLLKPTTRSIICDSNLIVAGNLPPSSSLQQHKSSKLSAAVNKGASSSSSNTAQQWSQEERAALEGQLALRAAGEPLCLDPSPVVSLVARKVRTCELS